MKTHLRTIVYILIVFGIVLAVVALRSHETSVNQASVNQQADQNGLTKTYRNNAAGFSVRYPADYTIDVSYKYQGLGLGKDISGVKFIVPASLATGTNLSDDSYISVEYLSETQNCTANLFIDSNNTANVASGNTAYSVAGSTGAAAGNRYEETVYALTDTNPCLAVRYFIHYGVIDNYPPGTVKEINKQVDLLNQFDSIRQSLIVNQ